MYPIALEKQYVRFVTKEFLAIADEIVKRIKRELKKEIAFDSDDRMRADSITNIMIFLQQLKEQYGNRIDQRVLEGKVKKHFSLIDAWSRDKTYEDCKKLYARLSTPGSDGKLYIPTISMRKALNEELIDNTVKRNVDLINNIYKNYFNDIANVVKTGVLNGEGFAVITNKLQAKTKVSLSKAQFWARDQIGKFFGQTTKIRQQEAGIAGYIWRCVGDKRTRDLHLALEGTFHYWNDPPVINGRKCHPGDDFNCRCWAEPAFGPKDAEKEFGKELPNDYFTSGRIASVPVNWSNESDFRQRIIIDINDAALKNKVELSLADLAKVIKLSPDKLSKPLVITQKKTKNIVKGEFTRSSISINDYETTDLTVYHEFFHYLDSTQSIDKKLKKTVIDVVRSSATYKNIVRELKNKALTNERRQYLRYLIQEDEMIARLFEQYMWEYKLKRDFGYISDIKDYYFLDNDRNRLYIFIETLLIKSGLL